MEEVHGQLLVMPVRSARERVCSNKWGKGAREQASRASERLTPRFTSPDLRRLTSGVRNDMMVGDEAVLAPLTHYPRSGRCSI